MKKPVIHNTAEQLLLPIALRHDSVFEHYLGNPQLVQTLRATANQQGEQCVYVYGKVGSGRTHLLQAICHLASQRAKRSVYLPLKEFKKNSPDIIEGLDSLDVICIDDLDAIVGDNLWEEAIFHLYNRIKASKTTYLVVVSHSLPKELAMNLPDLRSRLSAGLMLSTRELSDEEKIIALSMRAKERGLSLPVKVAEFLLHHLPRNTVTLFDTLDVIDKLSLQKQRAITLPFVREIIKGL